MTGTTITHGRRGPWRTAHRQMRGDRAVRDDRGSEAVELAILLPVCILVLAVLVVGARIALAADRIAGVAGIAARDASLARTPDQARQTATSSASAALSAADLHCTNVRVDVDTSGFATAPGTPASIRVSVWCTVDLSDIGVSGLPGAETLTDTAVSPLDPARDIGLGFGITERSLFGNRSGGSSVA